MQTAVPPDGAALRLTRRDLIRFEHRLRDILGRFVTFKQYSLYFPASLPEELAAGDGAAMYRAEDRRLMVPFVQGSELLGVFVARNIKLRAPKTLLPLLPALARLCLEQVRLEKASVSDPLTGLMNRQAFLAALARQIEQIHNCLLPSQSACVDPALSGFSGRVGVVVADVDHFQPYCEQHGFVAGETALALIAERLRQVCPEQVAICRLEVDGLALFWPEGSPAACQELAERMRMAVEGLDLPDGGRGPRHLTASLGAAHYPADLRGPEYLLPVAESARILLRKAQQAVAVAKGQGRNRIWAFNQILTHGGSVVETLPLHRVAVSLGRCVDAQEGQRFLVLSPRYLKEAEPRDASGRRLHGQYPTLVKGEISLVSVQEDMSFGEIINLSDAAWAIESGDRLHLVSDAPADRDAPGPGGAPQKDILTGLYAGRDFLRFLAEARTRHERFVLALVRLPVDVGLRGGEYQQQVEERARDVAGLVEELLGDRLDGGRYSLNSLCYFLPDRREEACRELFLDLARACGERWGFEPAVGLAGHPCLNFAKAAALDNCRKALDHALLLDAPQVAVFDSISLNVSADRLFAKGDIFGAVEEYKLALLADETNLLARNSLAVCLARVGRLEQAATLFEQVKDQDPADIMAHYNFGHAALRLGDLAAAAKAFRACLKLNPDHVFSLIRLGQIAEQQAKARLAAKFYRKVEKLSGGGPLAARHLARLALAAGDKDAAREYLHRAIAHNPQDAASIGLLAGLYLDGGEDAEIAAVLARQATELRPKTRSHWRLLVRALEALGRTAEARSAAASLASLPED